MILWRISRYLDLRGLGGLKVPGRWHYAGQPVVYLAGSPSAALLEVCVHTSASDVPPSFTLLKIEGPDMEIPVISLEDLPQNWRTRTGVTRDPGTEWLRKNAGALLQVPSAIVPETANYLFNPMHAASATFRIAGVFSYPFDARLKT
jgi:RES domain-containing protein